MAILIILFQILLLVSCSSGNEPKTQDQQMIFRLHPELQGVKVSDEKLGLEFVVPKNWVEVSDTILQKIREMPSEIKLVCAYTDKVNGDALMVSSLELQTESQFDKLIVENLKEMKVSEEQVTKFTCNKLDFTQVRILENQTAAYKLFVRAKPKTLVQFDFVLRIENIDEKTKILETVIGSIIKLKLN